MEVTPAAASTAMITSGATSLANLIDRIDVAEFDWETYEGTYRGRALITRLNHIPSLILQTSSTNTNAHALQLARTALQRLVPLVKATWDTSLYLRITTALEDTRHGPKQARKGEDQVMEDASAASYNIPAARPDIDMDWVEEAKEAERKEGSKLDVDLRNYMSNLIKESIRLTYLAFAQLAVKGGRANDALKNYTAAREFSTSPAHHVDLGVGIIDTALAFNNPSTLAGYTTKLDAALDRAYPVATAVPRVGNEAAAAAVASLTASDVRDRDERSARSAEMRRSVGVKIRVAKGLEALTKKEWERAGRELGEVGEEGGLAGWEGQAISTADLALITALCTLVSSKRERIRRVLLDRTSFRSAVDDSQAWLIDLVRAFMDAKYGEVTFILNKAESLLILNPFLYPHVRDIIDLIQTRAVVQYVAPFSSVKIETMAKAFGRDARSMLREVEDLVKDGRISGRIDLIDGVLEMKQENVRAGLFKDAMKVASDTNRTSKAALIRMRLHEAGITVDPRPPSDITNTVGGQRVGSGPNPSHGSLNLTGDNGFEMLDSTAGGAPGSSGFDFEELREEGGL